MRIRAVLRIFADESLSSSIVLGQYEVSEPMSHAKIKEHEPTGVKREMKENITGAETTTSTIEDARENARRSGMTKGTAGAQV